MAEEKIQAPETPRLEFMASRQFTSWLYEQRISLAFTTYQTGKLFFIGLQPNGQLSIFERTFNRCMGLWADPGTQTLWMSTLYQLWRFENFLPPAQMANGYDRMYVPKIAYTTGDLDIHDIVVEQSERLLFVNTLFGCVATLSEAHSFEMVWEAPFLSKLAAEDRCHLNGLALENGVARYTTAVSQSDVVDGWREHRRDGGCVMDMTTDQVIAAGLSMPHSPRVYRDKLWILNSGTGDLGFVDRSTGAFTPTTFCPGYPRGLAFHDQYAIVGLSKPRQNKTFEGLALQENLATKKTEARCGLQIIDLQTGDVVHWLRIEGIVEELYDVVVLPGVMRPMAIGLKTDEIRRVLSLPNLE